MKRTHDTMWKNNPSQKSVFVSNLVEHSFPALDKDMSVKKVLDVACGNGLGVSLPLLRRGLKVHSFDHLNSALKSVRENAEAEGFLVRTKRASMYKTFPYEAGEFDATFCFAAIYHGRLEQIMYALSEIKRVTRRGGYFFGNFLAITEIKYDAKKKMHYEIIRPVKNCGEKPVTGKPAAGKPFKAYRIIDKSEPHLFYFASKDFEYMVPHYYFSEEELNVILKQYFSQVKITCLKKGLTGQYFVHCRV